jgi:hypothetical protein
VPVPTLMLREWMVMMLDLLSFRKVMSVEEMMRAQVTFVCAHNRPLRVEKDETVL